MQILSYLAIFLLAGPGEVQRQEPASLEVVRLRCEYLVNPLGIDQVNPRLSWELLSDRQAQVQNAYQILVATDSLSLTRDQADMWDSGKIASRQSSQLIYQGKALEPGKKYYWKVRVWDGGGRESAWSPVAYWSMGLLSPSDWKASWIGAPAESISRLSRYYPHYGYHSALASSEGEEKTVILDLGEVREISSVRLYPADFNFLPDGYLFPRRFRIEASADDSFSQARMLADESGADLERRGLGPYIKQFSPLKARYVRLQVLKMEQADSSQYAFALGEMEVLGPKGENLALKKAVKVSDVHRNHEQFSNQNWLPERLTDGFLRANQDHKPNSLPIPPSPLLRKAFEVKKPVRRATVYVTALGLYELRLNGSKVGEQVLAPEWTDYHTRVLYQTYDVTSLLRKGENALGAMLADGWYAGAVFSHPERGSYGFDRRLLAQLEITYEDGSTDVVATDGSWKLWEEGPVRKASIFDGERFDARFLPEGWDLPGFEDARWQDVYVDESPGLHLTAQMNEPIRVIEELKPVEVIEIGEGRYIFDLGQNIAGWVRLELPYNPGRPLTLRHGEVLDEEGKLYTENLRGAKQTDVYIPGREERIVYEPRFTYHGFRYVEVSGLSRKPELSYLTGVVLASASPLAGEFECSSADVNKLWENILWTQRGNMHSTPTDCPQRDERAGWMGDAQVFSQTAIFNLDMAAFFTKWIRDIRDSQTPDGRFPDYAPQVGTWANFYNSPGWGDAGVITPWRLYENYGDTLVLAQQYEAMKRFLGNILSHNPDLLWKHARGNMYGDWLNGNTIIADDYPKEGGQVPNDVYSTAFFAYSTRIVADIARVLGRKADIEYYDSLAVAVRDAFVKAYVGSDGSITGNTQAGYALALEFGLVPEALREKAAQHMVEAIKAYDYRISTGIQSTIRLMNQLTTFGYSDIAYRLLESRRFPSWLYSIDQGATTIWERWDGYVKGRGFQDAGMNSFNHYAIGAVGEWFYRSILGIQHDPAEPAYRHFFIRPVPGGSLTWARGAYHSIAGRIGVSWKKEGEDLFVEVEIPVNTEATLVLPGKKLSGPGGEALKGTEGLKMLSGGPAESSVRLASGKYSFRVRP